MLTVVAGLIESNGRVLICQRRKGGGFGLKWEFPGGKVKPGEELKPALERELREELGANCSIGQEIYRTRFRYPEMRGEIELVFFFASGPPDSFQNLIFEQIRWAAIPTLADVDFLPADRELIEKLASGELPLPPIAAAGSS
jgi:mutator protein MutT